VSTIFTILLMERPIFHHLKHRTQTHIFLCVLAYHLLVGIEKYFLDRGIHTSWWTLRQQLTTHQVVTVVLPTVDGPVLRIRKRNHAGCGTTKNLRGFCGFPGKSWRPSRRGKQPENSD